MFFPLSSSSLLSCVFLKLSAKFDNNLLLVPTDILANTSSYGAHPMDKRQGFSLFFCNMVQVIALTDRKMKSGMFMWNNLHAEGKCSRQTDLQGFCLLTSLPPLLEVCHNCQNFSPRQAVIPTSKPISPPFWMTRAAWLEEQLLKSGWPLSLLCNVLKVRAVLTF